MTARSPQDLLRLAEENQPTDTVTPSPDVPPPPSGQLTDEQIAALRQRLEQAGAPPVAPSPTTVGPVQRGVFDPGTGGLQSGFDPATPFILTPQDKVLLVAGLGSIDPELGSGFNTEDAERFVSQFEKIATPELLDLFIKDPMAAFAQTVPEYMNARAAAQYRAMTGNPDPETQLRDGIYNSLRDSSWTQESTVLSVGQVIHDSKLAKQGWEIGDIAGVVAVDDGQARFSVAGNWGDEIPISTLGEFNEAFGGGELAADRLRDALDIFTGRGAQWAVVGETLAMRIDDGTGAWDVLVDLDPGTVIENNNDAAQAVMYAREGFGHTIREGSDEVPNSQTMAGSMWEGAGSVGRAIPGKVSDWITASFEGLAKPAVQAAGGTPQTISEKEEARLNEYVEKRQTAALAEMTPSALVAAAASTQFGDRPSGEEIILAAGPILAGGEELEDEIRQLIEENINAETVYEDFRLQEEDRNALADIATAGVRPLLQGVMWWDRAIHNIAIGALESIVGAGEAILTDKPFQEIFTNVVTEVSENSTFADYLDIDPGSNYAFWVNMGVSIFADPITYLTPGGKASWKWMEKTLTDPAMAAKYVRQPHMRAYARELVTRQSDELVWIEAAGGLSDEAVERILRISETNFDNADEIGALVGRPAAEFTEEGAKKQARKEAESRILDDLAREMVEGDWLPYSPTFIQDRKGLLGLGKLAKSNASGTAGSNDEKVLLQLLMRSSNNAEAALTHNEFLSDSVRWIAARYPNDPKKMNELGRAAMRISRAARSGSDDIANQNAIKAQALRQKMHDAALHGRRQQLDHVPQLRRNIDELTRDLNEVDELIEDAAAAGRTERATQLGQKRAQMERTLENNRRMLEVDGDEFDSVKAQIEDLYSQLRRLKAETKAAEGGYQTRAQERFWAEFMDDWAEETNVPFVTRSGLQTLNRADAAPHSVFDDLPRRDWSTVTGKKRGRPQTEPVGRRDPFLENVDEHEAQLIGAGFQTRAVATQLPVSMHEMVAYSAVASSKAGRAYWQKIAKSVAAQNTRNVLDGFGTVFSASVLFNPLTAIRSHLDELVRFYTETGRAGKTLQAAVKMRRDVSSRGFRVAEQLGGTPFPTRQSGWVPLDKTVRGQKGAHHRAAERFINGSLLEDLPFIKYAQAIRGGASKKEQRRIFQKWWDETGHKYSQRQTVPIKDPASGVVKEAEMTADIAFDALDRGFRVFVDAADDAAKFEKAILDAAVKGGKVTDKGIWRMAGKVPGQEQGVGLGGRGVNKFFDILYGAPQRRRAGVFYDHYNEWATNVYRTKYAGKILGLSSETREDSIALLVSRFGLTESQAVDALRAGEGNVHVRNLIRDSGAGYRLEADLQETAHRWAVRHTDSIMYTFGATSALGRKSQRLYPFGRAQMDYLQYWGRELAAPAQFKIPGFNRVFTPGVAGHRIPFNVRAWDRMGKLGLFAADDEERFRPQFGTPEWVTETFSFLPTRFDESLLLDIGPSPSPIASWVVNFLPEDSEARQLFDEFHPAHRVFNDANNKFNDPIGAFVNFFDGVSPKSGRSVRALFRAAAEFMLASTGGNANDLWLFADALAMEAEAPNFYDWFMIDLAGWLEENFDGIPDFDPDPGTFDDLERIKLQEGARKKGYSESAFQQLQKQIPLAGDAYSAQGSGINAQPRLWSPVLANLERWVEQGYMTDAKRDNLLGSFEVIEDWMLGEGTAKFSDVYQFSDAIYDTYGNLPWWEQSLLLVENPGLAVNLTSTKEILRDRVPQDVVDSGVIVGNRIDPTLNGTEARALRKRGKDEGWIVGRPDEDIFNDARNRISRAQRDFYKWVFERSTGRAWESTGQTQEWAASEVFVSLSRGVGAGLDKLGTPPPDGAIEQFKLPDGSFWFTTTNEPVPPRAELIGYSMSNGMLKDWMREERDRIAVRFEIDNSAMTKLKAIDRNAAPVVLPRGLPIDQIPDIAVSSFRSTGTVKDISFWGSQLADDFTKWRDFFSSEFGYSSPDEWPSQLVVGHGSNIKWPFKNEDGEFEMKTMAPGSTFNPQIILEELKDRFRMAVSLGHTVEPNKRFTEELYNRYFADDMGPLDWENPIPPPIDSLPDEQVLSTSSPQLLTIVDGDTISFETDDGEPVIFRLIGINAPEAGQMDHETNTVDIGAQATLDLMNFLESAESVSFVTFNPDLYGTTQVFKTREDGAVVDRERIFAWLYVDGHPVYDPDVFTALNPRGVGVGGDPINYLDIWQRPPVEGEVG